MKKSFCCSILMLFAVLVSQAQSKEMVFPAIQNYGGVFPVPFTTDRPDPTKHYKFVIELGKAVKDSAHVADWLDYAAKLYNIHRYAGIPKENIEMAIVIYAGSTPMVLNNPKYQSEFKLNNPNIPLLEELFKNGIRVIVCGQSMIKQDLLPGDIYPGVRMALSRLTATSDLMEKGYRLYPL